jgi:hypothetical protein
LFLVVACANNYYSPHGNPHLGVEFWIGEWSLYVNGILWAYWHGACMKLIHEYKIFKALEL